MTNEPAIFLAEATTVGQAQRLALKVGFPCKVVPAYMASESSQMFDSYDGFDEYVQACLNLSPISTIAIIRDEKHG